MQSSTGSWSIYQRPYPQGKLSLCLPVAAQLGVRLHAQLSSSLGCDQFELVQVLASYMQLSHCVWKTGLPFSHLSSPLALKIVLPIFFNYPQAWEERVCYRHPFLNEHSVFFYSLHHYQFQVSVLITIYCTTFFWWVMRYAVISGCYYWWWE